MKKARGCSGWVAVAVLSALSFSQAAIAASSVRLEPASPGIVIQIGDIVPFDLLMDFSADPTIGGGVDIQFNPDVLTFVSFTFNPAFPTDPAFTRQPDVMAGGALNSLGFGSFSGLSSGRVGTFEFQGSGAGTTGIELLGDGRPGDTAVVAGQFFSAVNFLTQPVSFNGLSVTVVPVPVPWGMLLAGFGMIVLRARSPARLGSLPRTRL